MELLTNIYEFLKLYKNIIFIIGWIWWLIFFIKFIYNKFKLYKILSNNLSREVEIILPTNEDEYKLENELKMLNNGIFNVNKPITSYNNFKSNNKIWLVIIWYKKWCISNKKKFDDLLKEIWKNTPIIVYTYWDNFAFDFRDKNEDWSFKDEYANILSEYDNYLIDNFPLKLISDVFSIISIYK